MAVDQIDTTEDRGQTKAAMPLRVSPFVSRGFEMLTVEFDGFIMGRSIPYVVRIPRDPASAMSGRYDEVLALHALNIMRMYWDLEAGVNDLRRQLEQKDAELAELRGRVKSAEARAVESERPRKRG